MSSPRKPVPPRGFPSTDEGNCIQCARMNDGTIHHVPVPRKPRIRKKLAGPLANVPPHVVASFRSSYEEASKHLESGLAVDYFALAHAFRERSAQGLLVITNILDDFSYYTKEVLDAELYPELIPSPCPEAEEQCYSCNICRKRRRMLPSDIDIEYLQCFVTGLLDMTFQNFFHRLLWTGPGPIQETYQEALTPIHNMFRTFEIPAWDGWRECIKVYERQGSHLFEFPIRPEDLVPTGCPATLAYQEQGVIHDFIDRVLCHSQLLHEKHGVKAHYTTTLDNGLDCCAVCEVTAAYFIPALVAPYFMLRQHRRERLGVDLSQALEEHSADRCVKTLLDLTSTQIEPNFPVPNAPWPDKPNKSKSRKKKRTAIVKANPPRYQPTLLPTTRAAFVPRQRKDGLDIVKHPYSYFLSLTGEERKIYLRAKVNRTRHDMGCPELPFAEDSGVGVWKCGWFSLAEIGENVSEHISSDDGFCSLLKDLRKMIDASNFNSGPTRRRGSDGEHSTVFELRGRNVSTQVLEMAVNELRKLSADQVAQMAWIRKRGVGPNGFEITAAGATNDVLDMAIAHLTKVQAEEMEAAVAAMEVGGEAQRKEPGDADQDKKRKKRARRKSRAADGDIDAAAEQA